MVLVHVSHLHTPTDATRKLVDGDFDITRLYRVWFMVFNATFNNISVISWQSVLLVEETRAPRENHRSVASHCCIDCTSPWWEFEATTSVVIGIYCFKSNYHTITTGY